MKAKYGSCYFDSNMVKYDVTPPTDKTHPYIAQIFFNPNGESFIICTALPKKYTVFTQYEMKSYDFNELLATFNGNELIEDFIENLIFFIEEIENTYKCSGARII